MFAKALKGISDEYLSVSIVHPIKTKTKDIPDSEDNHVGWKFTKPNDAPVTPYKGRASFSCEGTVHDDVFNAPYIRDIYERFSIGHKNHGGVFSVPVFFDKKESKIINN